MLFLFADFIEALVARVLKYLDKKQDKKSGNCGNIFDDLSNNLNKFDAPLGSAPSAGEIKKVLSEFSDILPEGEKCTCIAFDKIDNKEIARGDKDVSIKACQALGRVYSDRVTIQYLPPKTGA